MPIGIPIEFLAELLGYFELNFCRILFGFICFFGRIPFGLLREFRLDIFENQVCRSELSKDFDWNSSGIKFADENFQKIPIGRNSYWHYTWFRKLLKSIPSLSSHVFNFKCRNLSFAILYLNRLHTFIADWQNGPKNDKK